MNKHAEACAYLGVPVGTPIHAEIVEAITADDFGLLPPEITNSPTWEAATDHDREEIARFAAFLRAAGRAPLLAAPERAGEAAEGEN